MDIPIITLADNKLIPKNILSEKLSTEGIKDYECKVCCIINKNLITSKNKTIIKEIMNELQIPVSDNYYDIIRLIRVLSINSRGRLCRWLSGFENKSFQEDIFIIIAYIEVDSKKYITGFFKIKNGETDIDYRTNYICTDLYFKGIGHNLINLLKIILLNSKSRVIKVRIPSILRPSTQNFYTQQKFYKLPDQPDSKSVLFEWNKKSISQRDKIKLNLFKENFIEELTKLGLVP